MELDIDQIAENLNAFEKFLDTLPEKALGLGVRGTVCSGFIFCRLEVDQAHTQNHQTVTSAGKCRNWCDSVS